MVTKESRFATRVLRGLFALRKKLDGQHLRRIVNGFYTHSNKERDDLLAYIVEEDPPADAMDTDESATPAPTPSRLRGAKSALTPLLPEVDCFLHLLVLLHLLDAADSKKQQGQARLAVECADALARKIVAQNRRSLDHIAARAYYYYMRAHEAAGQIAQIRGFLHSRLRTATLRNDFEGQAVLINCLVRSYVNHNLYDQVETDSSFFISSFQHFDRFKFSVSNSLTSFPS